MIGSINGWEWVIIAVIALLVVGPDRLPEFVRQAGRVLREVRRVARGAQDRVKEELGPQLDELRAYDPRQLDPRRAVQEMWDDDAPAPRPTASAPVVAYRPDAPLAFDDEAT